jgi:hypothetical protein
MAGFNQEAKTLTRSLAEEIIKRDEDQLKRAAERFLNSQPGPQPASGLTPINS